MRIARLSSITAIFCLTAVAAASAQLLAPACDAAAARAERDWNIPAGVLAAVGTVESGRVATELGAAPWPWTINAAGQGAFFASKPEAIAGVLAVMQRGYPYIDVGCFQIDILYHAGIFRSLDEAFDPELNAQAAASILTELRHQTPDWASAVARYHSANAALGLPYLEHVRAALPAAKLRASIAEYSEAMLGGPDRAALDRPKLPQVVYLGSSSPKPQPQIVHMPSRQAPLAVASAAPRAR